MTSVNALGGQLGQRGAGLHAVRGSRRLAEKQQLVRRGPGLIIGRNSVPDRMVMRNYCSLIETPNATSASTRKSEIVQYAPVYDALAGVA